MRNQLAYGLSLIAPLTACIALVACQFVAGINDELPNSTSASTGTSTVTSTVVSVSSSSTGGDCGPTPGTACSTECAKYCGHMKNNCASQNVQYPSEASCCAICGTFSNTADAMNTAACRDGLAVAPNPNCKDAGPYSTTCGSALISFQNATKAICGAPAAALSFPGQEGALNFAAEAKYFGCADTCFCADVIMNQGSSCDSEGNCAKLCL
jgi:hypothetical protein